MFFFNQIKNAEEAMKKRQKQGLWLDLNEELGSLASYLKPVELTLHGESFPKAAKKGIYITNCLLCTLYAMPKQNLRI